MLVANERQLGSQGAKVQTRMPVLLLTVEDTFRIRKRGVVLMPAVAEEALQQEYCGPVRLALPNGERRIVEAICTIPFINPLPESRGGGHSLQYVCLLRHVERDDVPIGTEVWLDTPSAPQP